MSVKGGCLTGLDWKKAIHIWTKSAMVPIPEGSESHSEESSQNEFGTSQELLDQPTCSNPRLPLVPSSSGEEKLNAANENASEQQPLPSSGELTSRVRGACELSG